MKKIKLNLIMKSNNDLFETQVSIFQKKKLIKLIQKKILFVCILFFYTKYERIFYNSIKIQSF